jgi:cobalt/nickel transport system ATP-binding protein
MIVNDYNKDNVLETFSLSYEYPDGTMAINNLNIKIKRGKTTAIIGGNGAGKTTMFLNLNGILKPSEGKVVFNGEPVQYSREGLRQLRMGVGIVFQDPDNQLFSASVLQDVSFGVMNMKLSKEETSKRVYEAIERSGISEIKDKPTHSLSFGQKKRVAIAGVLAMEPEVLVLDEPTAGLDPLGVASLMKLLRETQSQMELSVVIATHDIDIVPLYCDYVYVMDKGQVILEGTPIEVFKESDTLRKVNLRLPRIAHLMEILEKEDGFGGASGASTISQARKVINEWIKHLPLKQN